MVTFRVLAKGDLDANAALASPVGCPPPPRSLTPARQPLSNQRGRAARGCGAAEIVRRGGVAPAGEGTCSVVVGAGRRGGGWARETRPLRERDLPAPKLVGSSGIAAVDRARAGGRRSSLWTTTVCNRRSPPS